MSRSVRLFPLYDFMACTGKTMPYNMGLQLGKKETFTLEQVTRAQRGSRGTALLFPKINFRN